MPRPGKMPHDELKNLKKETGIQDYITDRR
jgi:hypothetical protein